MQINVGDIVQTFASWGDTTDRSITATVGALPGPNDRTTLYRLDSPHWLGGAVYRTDHEFDRAITPAFTGTVTAADTLLRAQTGLEALVYHLRGADRVAALDFIEDDDQVWTWSREAPPPARFGVPVAPNGFTVLVVKGWKGLSSPYLKSFNPN